MWTATAAVPAATEWVLHFENKGGADTEIISKVLPLDMTVRSGADAANASSPTFTVLHADGSNSRGPSRAIHSDAA